MYYKITNKESEVYQKLHEMRTKELKIESDNKVAIKEKIGLDFTGFLGYPGQQNLCRVSQYSGFKFNEPEKADPKIWQEHKQFTGYYIPNKRTKLGREMEEFLSMNLGSSCFTNPLDILQLEPSGRFSFPFVEIVNDTIILFIDISIGVIKDENVIEITSREFKEIREGREISRPVLI